MGAHVKEFIWSGSHSGYPKKRKSYEFVHLWGVPGIEIHTNFVYCGGSQVKKFIWICSPMGCPRYRNSYEMNWFTLVVWQPGPYFLWKVTLQQSMASSSAQERIPAPGHVFCPSWGKGVFSHEGLKFWTPKYLLYSIVLYYITITLYYIILYYIIYPLVN